MRMAHLLDGLCCADCLTLDVLWYDPVRGMVECAECGHRAHILPEIIDSMPEVIDGDEEVA